MSGFGSFASLSTSSQGFSKTSSHMSNKVKREVARLAVDSYKSLSPGGGDIHNTGKRYPKLSGELGEEDFKLYCAEPPILSLQKILYCQSRLEQLRMMVSGSSESNKKELKDLSGEEVTSEQAQGIQKMRGLINHEYLVLEVRSPTDKLYILAEKNGGQNAGIYIKMADPADYDEKHVVLYAIDCGKVPMKLDSLQSLLLESAIPHYSLRDSNCWDFATSATKRLLMECIAKVTGCSDEERARLQKELEDLEANLNSKNIVNTWKKVTGWSSRAAKKVVSSG